MISPTLTRRACGLIALSLATIVMAPERGSAGGQSASGSIPPSHPTPTAIVSVHTSKPPAVISGFFGYNVALMYSGVEYPDPRLHAVAASMAIGWLRFPAGTGSDAFDWTTGQAPQAWVNQFETVNQYTTLRNALKVLSGKGGDHFDDAADLSRDVGSVGLIVCVNGYSDSAASAGRLAAYAKAHGIRVLARELSNEPYYFPGFFADATAYADKMRPFAHAIKAADPSAQIALFASDAGHQNKWWDDALASYAPRYWDLVTYHHYPSALNNITDAPTLMSLLNDVLVNSTSSYVRSQIVPRFGPMPVIITEFDFSTGSGAYGLASTLYGGVWAAEYALRLSAYAQVKRVGMHQLVNASGIELANNHLTEVLQAYAEGTTVDTTHLNFGYFKSAQAGLYAVAAGAINSASRAYSTSVVGGSTVPLAGGGTVPALYAQAYERRERRELPLDPGSAASGEGSDFVVTNKGSTPEVISIAVDGQGVSSPFVVITATGAAGPTDANTLDHAGVEATDSLVYGTVWIPPLFRGPGLLAWRLTGEVQRGQ